MFASSMNRTSHAMTYDGTAEHDTGTTPVVRGSSMGLTEVQ